MNNGNGERAPTYKFWLGVAGAIITILLSVTSMLTLMGVNSLREEIKETKIEFSKRCEAGEIRDQEMAKRTIENHSLISELQIYITMPFDRRIETLERLKGVKR